MDILKHLMPLHEEQEEAWSPIHLFPRYVTSSAENEMMDKSLYLSKMENSTKAKYTELYKLTLSFSIIIFLICIT